MKPGTREILESTLQTIENQHPQRDYEVSVTCPEFTALCPLTGYPDFGVIRIRYIPDRLCLELKSIKLYINGYRDVGIFHEDAVNRILDDLVQACQPRWMEVEGDFNPRGNVKTAVRAEYRKEG